MTTSDRPVADVDGRDAAAFVEELNRLRPSFVPEEEIQELRTLMRARKQIGRDPRRQGRHHGNRQV